MKKQYNPKILENSRKMLFSLNTGAFMALGKEGIGTDNIWCSELGIFSYGALFIIFSALISYFSDIYRTKYFFKRCGNKEKTLKNIFVPEDYVSKKSILVILIGNLQTHFMGIFYSYYQKLDRHKEFKNPNEYNFKISQDFAKASVAYCFLSALFFVGGVHLSQTPGVNTSLLYIILNFVVSGDFYFILMMLVFGYAIYQMIVNPLKHENKKRKMEKVLAQSV